MFVIRRSPSRLVSLLLAAPAVVGCTNLLGLDGLEYQEPPAETEPHDDDGDVTAAGGGGSVGDLPDGEPGLALHTFPATWAKGLLIAGASDSLGTYYTYDPSDGALVVRQGASTTLPLREDLGEPGWELTLAFADGDSHEFVGYDSDSGLTERGGAPSASRAFTAEPAAGTPGWTSLTTLDVDGVPHAFVYSTATGNARVGRWSAEDVGLETTTLDWNAGFSDVAGAEIDGTSGVVRFDHAGAVLEFVPVTSEGVGEAFALAPLPESTTRVIVVPRGYVTTEVDPAVATPLAAPDANSRLIAYDGNSGRFSLLHVEDDGTLLAIDSEVYRGGLSAIVPLRGADGPFALLYSSETGVVDVITLEPLIELPPVVIR